MMEKIVMRVLASCLMDVVKILRTCLLMMRHEGVLESDEMSTNTSHRGCNGFMDFSFIILWFSYFLGPTKKMILTLIIIPVHNEDDSFGGATLTLTLQALFFFIFFFKIAL